MVGIKFWYSKTGYIFQEEMDVKKVGSPLRYSFAVTFFTNRQGILAIIISVLYLFELQLVYNPY